MIIQNIGLFARLDDQRITGTLRALRAHLGDCGVQLVPKEEICFNLFADDIDTIVNQVQNSLDLGVAVGGDGTMLHLARHFSSTSVPLIGINLGRLGFLTDISADHMLEEFDEILSGRYYTERRILIKAEVQRHNQLIAEGVALNDVVIAKGDTGRMIEYTWHVNNELVGTTRGDGVIVTTPTGSTAYALSAAGPIMHPTLPALSVVPICPHTLSHRPIVLEDTSVIKMNINDLADAGGHVFLDGINIASLEGDEVITIRKSEGQSVLVRAASHNHFEALRSKLGWAG